MSEKDCPHCPDGIGLRSPLLESENFLLVCDISPLTEGHMLLITKEHLSCMGALPKAKFKEYKKLYRTALDFLKRAYGKAFVFEHGITGQTVFHAHTHFLPYSKSIREAVPEKGSLEKIRSLDDMKKEFIRKGKYIYAEVNDEKWLVDTTIAYPAFFRRRLAKTFGSEERASSTEARKNPELVKLFEKDIQNLKEKWKFCEAN